MLVSQGEDRYHQQRARLEQDCGIAPGAASVRVWQIALGVAGDAGGAREGQWRDCAIVERCPGFITIADDPGQIYAFDGSRSSLG